MRNEMMVFLLLISYSFWPFYHRLLFVFRGLRGLLKGHLNWLVSHSVGIYNSYTASGSWLTYWTLLHQDYILEACLYWLGLSNDCLILFVIRGLLNSKSLLVLLLLWRYNTCPAKYYLATLRCCMLLIRLNLNLRSWLKNLLTRCYLIYTVRVLVINKLVHALLWLLLLLILMLRVLWLFFLFIKVLGFEHNLYPFVLSHRF
jgi:hypothetical protein